jgi:hypothetical protein
MNFPVNESIEGVGLRVKKGAGSEFFLRVQSNYFSN